MAKREAGFGVVAGRTRIGKSVQTMRLLIKYAAGNPSKGVPPRRVIILDVNNEYGNFEMAPGEYVKIKAMRLRDVKAFSMNPIIEIRRIQPFKEDGTKMTTTDVAKALGYIISNFSGGLILLEDLNKYVTDSMPQDIVSIICTAAHSAIDLVVQLQSVGRILPKMYQNLSWVRFHKHYESMDDCRDKLGERYEIFKITELIVNKKYNEGNKRYFLHIHRLDNKIRGDYTKQDLLEAIEEYLSINFSKVVTPFANRRNMKGEKIRTVEQAMKILRNRLYLDYYGN